MNLEPLLKCRGLTLMSKHDKWEFWGNDLKQVAVYVEPLQSVQVGFVTRAYELLVENKLLHCIAQYAKTISPPARSMIRAHAFLGKKLEFLHCNIVCCDILAHYLQPKFRVCSIAQSRCVRQQHIHTMNQICSDDAVAIWMELQVGQIVALCDDKCDNELDHEGKCCASTRWKQIVQAI